MRPRIVLFQPESPGFIEWVFELFRFLFGVLDGLILWFLLHMLIVFVVAVSFSAPAWVHAAAVGAAALIGLHWFAGRPLLEYLRLRGADVEVCQDGVRVRYVNGRTVELLYKDIAGFDGAVFDIRPNGRYWGDRWDLTLYQESDARLVPTCSVSGYFKGGIAEEHPIRDFWRCTLQAAHDATVARLESGKPVHGGDWEIRDRQLIARRQSIPLGEIEAAEVQDGRLCIWQKGFADPTLRVAFPGPNAHVLLELLREAQPAGHESENSLGRAIIRRWWLGFDGMMTLVFAGGAVAVALVILQNLRPEPWQSATVLAAVGIPCLALLYRLLTRRLAVYENGIVQRGLLQTVTLRDTDIEGLRYGETRYYVNGAYQGTIVELIADPHADAGKRPVRFRALLRPGREGDVEGFRNRVAGRIAERFLDRLRAGQPANMRGVLVLTADGLSFRTKQLIGHGPEALVPYDDIEELRLEHGICAIVRRSTATVAGSVPQDGYNFWPVYFAVSRLLRESDDRSREDRPEAYPA